MIDGFLDPYELKARIAPGVIIVLPALADIAYAAPVVNTWSGFAATGVLGLALLYGLSHVVRAFGKSIQPKLWDVAPSTRLMRRQDSTFGEGTKESIRVAIASEFAIQLVSAQEEAQNPTRADDVIFEAFRHVREYLRQENPGGLWFKQGVEYGFCRNLMGCRFVWTAVSVCATAFAMGYAAKTGGGILNPAAALGLISIGCALYVGWSILPGAARRSGEAYAESAWIAFLRTSTSDGHQQKQA
jgi:hypothetical protein